MSHLHVCFACDAGMGSSALGASLIKRYLKEDAIQISNCAINCLNSTVDIVIIQKQLLGTIKNPQQYLNIYTVDHFLDEQKLKKIVKEIKTMLKEKTILAKDAITTNCPSVSSDEAIKQIGRLLLKKEYIEEPYIEGMIARDHDITTYIGNDIAIPHGEYDVKQYVKETGLAVMIYPSGIDWHGERVRIVIGIAAKGEEHMEILSNIALKLSDMSVVDDIVENQNVEDVYQILTSKEE